MKRTLLSLSILILVTATSFGMVPMPPLNGTNDLALTALAYRIQAMDQRIDYLQSQNDTLQHEIDHLETGFLILMIGVVAALAGICILMARDKSRDAIYRSSSSMVQTAKGLMKAIEEDTPPPSQH
jgi:hypothetical protein